ncbi:MAG: P-loop NTPase [Chitinispirillaceae bacterium]|nr:P-loop NTPase [Chitinispirillaceae bacterium]
MVIAVASGKGGTGKTTFSVNLAYALADTKKKVRLLDCDVEEPNDHLFVKPVFTEHHAVHVLKPVLDTEKCTGCGKCAEACNYKAIAVIKGKVLLFNELCHSCGVCSYVCPENAFLEKEAKIGVVETAPAHDGFFFAHGKLDISETLAPKVVAFVKKYIDPESINIIDASPGTACPVVKALEDADVAVLVTEPTPFGLNDLKLAVAMSLKMGIPTGIIVNRSDGKDEIIEQYARNVHVPIIGRIPFSRAYAETYSDGGILVQHHGELRDNLLEIFENTAALAGKDIPAVPLIEDFAPSTASFSHSHSGGDSAEAHKEITVISGKGGTGKTTITACFAQLAGKQVLADNDVDAADLHLLFSPRVRESHPFVGGIKATIDSSKCIGCGKCAEMCHFNAIRRDGPANDTIQKTYRIEGFACEGCGLCPRVCPVDAISANDAVTGNWFDSVTAWGPMAHARLGIAEENSGRLVTQVRTRAADLAREQHLDRILGDGPPGTGCPVIASVSGTDLVVVVTEPTVSGVHDMERVLELSSHFGVPAVVIINKADINSTQAKRIADIAVARNSNVIGSIPFDTAVNDALMDGETVIAYGDSPAAQAIRSSWGIVCEILRK